MLLVLIHTLKAKGGWIKIHLKLDMPYSTAVRKKHTRKFNSSTLHTSFCSSPLRLFPHFHCFQRRIEGTKKSFIYCRCGAHIYNHYLDCRDTDYYVCEDSISDVLALPGEKVKHLTPVLACHDRSIRVLRDSTLMYNVELPGPPSCLALFYNDGGENGDEVLYGTEDGKIGLLQLTRYFWSKKEK